MTAPVKTDLSQPRIAVAGVSKTYPGTNALVDLDLTVLPGEIHGIAGQNGAGKSTLVRILSGAEKPDKGVVLLDGEHVVLDSPQAAQRAQIMTVHQEFSLMPHLSVAENIHIGAMPRTRVGTVAWRHVRRDAQAQLERLGFQIDVRRPVNSLPIAHRQAVEIAKAVSRSARVLILDEPTATLPRYDVVRLFELLRQLKQMGIAIIYISHHFDEMYEICDRISVVRDGRKVGEFAGAAQNHDEILQAMLGNMKPEQSTELQLGASRKPRLGLGRTGGDTVLELRGLRDGRDLTGLDLTLHRGEVLGIAGLSGNGQSQLAAALFGATPYQCEMFKVDGKHVRINSPRAAIRHGIGLLPEERKSQGLVLGMSITSNITMASLRKFSRFGFVRKRAEERRAQEMRSALKIKLASLGYPVRNLSGGNQQKVAIAKWLLSGVRYLIVVEPTRGVDVGAKLDIYELIRRFVESGGSAIVITSEIDEALMCDRISVISRGRIVASIDRDAIEAEGESGVLRHFI